MNWQLWIAPACKVHILFAFVTDLKPQTLNVSMSNKDRLFMELSVLIG